MGDRLSSDWIVPILEDLRSFAAEHDLPKLASDLEELLSRHRASLESNSQDSESKVLVLNPKRGSERNRDN